MVTTTDQWTTALADSRERVLRTARAGRHGAAALVHATGARVVAAWTLEPAPVDPVAHLESAHAEARWRLSSERMAPGSLPSSAGQDVEGSGTWH